MIWFSEPSALGLCRCKREHRHQNVRVNSPSATTAVSRTCFTHRRYLSGTFAIFLDLKTLRSDWGILSSSRKIYELVLCGSIGMVSDLTPMVPNDVNTQQLPGQMFRIGRSSRTSMSWYCP